MSATKNAQKAVIDSKIPASIKTAIETLAKGLGVAAIELWSIFVRQYIVKGLANLFTALVLSGSGAYLATIVGWWALIPLVASLPFFYSTIYLLGNPKYYAIGDITDKINELR